MSTASFVEYALGQRFGNFAIVASVTLLLYDYFLSFEDEVKYVWFAQWNIGKVLYCVNRYSPLIDTVPLFYHRFSPIVTQTQCGWLSDWVDTSFAVGIVAADAILLLRTWVIWGATRRGAIVIGTTSVVLVIGGVLCDVFWSISFQFITSSYPTIPGCLITGMGERGLIPVIWAYVLGVELLILIATLVRGMRYYLSRTGSDTVNILYWDALRFSAIISGCSYLSLLFQESDEATAITIMNLSVTLTQPPWYETTTSKLQRDLHAIIASHVMLRLRKTASDVPQSEGDVNSQSLDEALSSDNSDDLVSAATTLPSESG